MSLGPLIAGIFSEQIFLKEFGYALPFYFASLMALVAVVWIFMGFQETARLRSDRRIEPLRPVYLFADAYRHKGVRLLAIIVLLFQTGFGVYYQLISVYFRSHFNYPSSNLGYYYGYMGLLFSVGILVILPSALKRWQVGWIGPIALTFMALFQILSMVYVNDLYTWLAFVVIGPMNTVAYAALLTLFSVTADERRQGWVMGIFAATVAVSYVLSGATANLLPYLDSRWLILLGGVLCLLGGLLLFRFMPKHESKSC